MDSAVKIYIQRALNEISAAKLLFEVSNNKDKRRFQH